MHTWQFAEQNFCD